MWREWVVINIVKIQAFFLRIGGQMNVRKTMYLFICVWTSTAIWEQVLFPHEEAQLFATQVQLFATHEM